MSDTIKTVTDQLVVIFTATEEALNAYQGEGNLQFPTLMGMLAAKMNWTEKQVRESDPIVRYYVRSNPDWHVTRGAHGGIMRTSDRQKKEQARMAKEALKQQMKATIEAKAAQATDSNELSDHADDTDSQDMDS